MNDMSQVIIPKADQISADDLLAGPLTIRITSVAIKPGTEQPVAISFDGDGGRPWKPCKSMSRVLVAAWGPDANAYKGRSATLYRDPSVKWGGMEVGGIRVSHLSDMKSALVLALTATKGSKKPFTVKPLVVAPEPATTGAPKFSDWLPIYRARLSAATDAESLLSLMASDDTAIAIRNKGSDKQKAALLEIEADVRAMIEAIDQPGSDTVPDDGWPGPDTGSDQVPA